MPSYYIHPSYYKSYRYQDKIMGKHWFIVYCLPELYLQHWTVFLKLWIPGRRTCDLTRTNIFRSQQELCTWPPTLGSPLLSVLQMELVSTWVPIKSVCKEELLLVRLQSHSLPAGLNVEKTTCLTVYELCICRIFQIISQVTSLHIHSIMSSVMY